MNRLKNYVERNSDKLIEYAVPLTASLIICRTFPVLSFFYYAVPFILLFTFIFYLTLNHNLHPAFTKVPASRLNLAFNKRLKTLLILLSLFSFWAALTSAWSPFPQVSLTRSAYFLFISIASVLLGFLWEKNERNDLFGYLLPANMIVMMVSIYSLITSSPSDAWTGGHGLGFKGFASHQNTLASSILLTIPGVFYPLLKEGFSNPISKILSKKNLFFFVIFILNLYFLLSSVSRAGIFSIVIMIVTFFLFKFNLKGKIIFLLLLVSFSAAVFYSSQRVKEFIFKTEKNIGDRRIENVRETVSAAENGGLFGIGYGISKSPSNEKVKGYYLENGKLFIREKMISVLALTEEAGIIGCCLFLSPILLVFWWLNRNKKMTGQMLNESENGQISEKNEKEYMSDDLTGVRIKTSFLLAVLIAFCFHAQIEAWWVGVGSIELPLFFMVLGQATRFISWKSVDESSI